MPCPALHAIGTAAATTPTANVAADTYGIEYTLQGRPQGFNTIGEWSLDKRHYGGAYPPPNLDPPPNGVNPSTRWLWNAWNTAINAAGDTWPATNAMGTIGWRRESISSSEIRK